MHVCQVISNSNEKKPWPTLRCKISCIHHDRIYYIALFVKRPHGRDKIITVARSEEANNVLNQNNFRSSLVYP